MEKEPLDLAILVYGISTSQRKDSPWFYYQDALKEKGIQLQVFEEPERAFAQPHEAMMLHIWQDWKNKIKFEADKILPIIAQHAAYRAKFPHTVQIALNHTDQSRYPFATPSWRLGDPVLYRTPAYDRNELHPLPPEEIWPYEKVFGGPVFRSEEKPKYKAGFIGSTTGPHGYRQHVAEQTHRVGIGVAEKKPSMTEKEYARVMSQCEIAVCPRGWGQQSKRHWDAWLSGKPVLTDRACNSVEMIPGVRLQDGVHYLVFNDPEEIPSMVNEWTQPARKEALAKIAEAGYRAARSYNALERIVAFFNQVIVRRDTHHHGMGIRSEATNP